MKKMIDSDMVKEALEEMGGRITLPLGTSQIPVSQAVASPSPFSVPSQREGMHLGATSGALIGAITGALIANKKVKQDALKRQVELERLGPSLNGNYYSQSQNVAKNLKVIFTPLGVIYTVKNGSRETTIDNIETSEMNESMYSAWQSKDYNYYSNLMLTKMYSEMQMVEQGFAKRFLSKQMNFQKEINKKASVQHDIREVDFDEITDYELLECVASTKDMYSGNPKIFEKMAEAMILQFDDIDDYDITLQLDRPFDKYAGFTSTPLSFMGFNNNSKDIRSMQKKFLNSSYLDNKVNVGFMPDRVVYIVDNQMIGTLPAIKMNEDGYEHFQNQDKNYFREFFHNEVKRGLARAKGLEKPNSSLVKTEVEEKKASLDIGRIFRANDIHPVVYFLILTQKYGFAWFDFDPTALVKIIEDDFNVSEGIESVPLNKILSIQVANNSDTPFNSYHAFEKVIRSFAGKKIDFLKRESDDLDISDIAFAIDILDRVTPNDDIYDNFSPDIFDYLTKILSENENYTYMPSMIVGSPSESQFNEILNYSLLTAINNNMTATMNSDDKLEALMIKDNETIFDVSMMTLQSLRNQQNKGKISSTQGRKFMVAILDKLNIKKSLREIITRQVLKNIALDEFLVQKEELLHEQLEFFGIKPEGSEQ